MYRQSNRQALLGFMERYGWEFTDRLGFEKNAFPGSLNRALPIGSGDAFFHKLRNVDCVECRPR